MIRKILVASILFAMLASGARAAVVTLKDGSSLRGAIAGQTADGVELVTPDGTLHIGYVRILRIDYAEPLPGLSAPPSFEAAPAPPAGPARAASERRQMVSVGIGLIQPVSRVDFHSIGGGSADNGDLGAQLGVQYVYPLTRRLGAGFDVDYFDRGGTVSERLFPAASASVSGDSSVMLGILRYSFTDRKLARPFLLLGAGGAWNSETVDVRPSGNWANTGTHETRRLIDDSAWVPAASARLGMDFDVDALEPGVVTFEVGWTGLASARYGATPQGQALGLSNIAAPVNIISFTARYGFRF
jgi:hypothetical protein